MPFLPVSISISPSPFSSRSITSVPLGCVLVLNLAIHVSEHTFNFHPHMGHDCDGDILYSRGKLHNVFPYTETYMCSCPVVLPFFKHINLLFLMSYPVTLFLIRSADTIYIQVCYAFQYNFTTGDDASSILTAIKKSEMDTNY